MVPGELTKPDAAAGAGVDVVRLVGEGDVTVRGRHGATGQGAVTVVVVPRAVLALVAVRVGAVRRQDHVVGVAVGRGGGVAEVRGGVDRLGPAGGRWPRLGEAPELSYQTPDSTPPVW